MNLANPKASAWFMKSLRRDALLEGAEFGVAYIKTFLGVLSYNELQWGLTFSQVVWHSWACWHVEDRPCRGLLRGGAGQAAGEGESESPGCS
eukprot:1142166-Pelagomonas_calceolata.AAC.1